MKLENVVVAVVMLGIVGCESSFQPATAVVSAEKNGIDSAWLEGSAEQRSRLADLEAAGVPPSLQLQGWHNSAPLDLVSLRGNIVLLDFWATWCGPCIRSIPHTNEVYRQYKELGVVVIGVCHSRGSEELEDAIAEHGIEYPVAVDPEGSTIAAYEVNGYPDYYLIDRSGRLRFADCKNGSVDDALQFLLNESP